MRIPAATVTVLLAGALSACGGDAPRTDEVAVETQSATPSAQVKQFALQNEWAEAFTITLAPGEALPAHDGAARVVYSLGDYTIRYTEGDSTRETTWQRGDVHTHGAGEHAIENIGTTPAQLLIVHRTSAPLPAGGDVTDATPSSAPLVDDDRLTVREVTLEPAASEPAHAGRARVVYALTDYTIRYETDGEAPTERSFTAGQAHWHDAGQHRVTNIGTTPARFLVVQFKQ
jgi:quercetin dioxygenase-like cupin family protein